MLEKLNFLQIWCCAGISTCGGRKSDGSFVGLKADVKEPFPSTVWIGTSTHSCSKVTILDANTPSNAIDQFIVCSSHLLCMAAVPGVSNTDLGFEDKHSDKPHRKYSDNIQGSRPPIGARSYSYGSGTEMRSSLPRRKAGSQDVNFVGTSGTLSEHRFVYIDVLLSCKTAVCIHSKTAVCSFLHNNFS